MEITKKLATTFAPPHWHPLCLKLDSPLPVKINSNHPMRPPLYITCGEGHEKRGRSALILLGGIEKRGQAADEANARGHDVVHAGSPATLRSMVHLRASATF